MNGALEAQRCELLTRDHFSNRKLKIRELSNAIVVPGSFWGGGIVHCGKFMSEAMVHRGWHSNLNLRVPEQVADDARTVVYLGEFYSCWGHCLTDGLKHAWVFLPEYCEIWNRQDFIFVYTTTGSGEMLYENFLQCWEALGVCREKMVCISKPTRFAKVFFPEESFWLDEEQRTRVYSHEYLETIDAIRQKFVPRLGMLTRCVYLSRTKWKTSKPDFGEKRLEGLICGGAGYESVSPEKLSLAEMVRLLSECRKVVATEGSLAHNAVFMQDGAELVILRKADYCNGYQFPINQMRHLKVTWLKAHMSHFFEFPDEPWRGPFYLCVTKEVADYFEIMPQWSKLEYVRYISCCILKKVHRALSIIKHRVAAPLIKFFT